MHLKTPRKCQIKVLTTPLLKVQELRAKKLFTCQSNLRVKGDGTLLEILERTFSNKPIRDSNRTKKTINFRGV